MLPGGSSSTRSGGSPKPRETRSVTAEAGAARRVTFVGLRNDDQFFRARGLVRQAEGHDTAFANSIGARRKFLDFVRIQIAPAFDDDVLHAAGNVDFSVGAIRAIARIHPRVFPVSG